MPVSQPNHAPPDRAAAWAGAPARRLAAAALGLALAMPAHAQRDFRRMQRDEPLLTIDQIGPPFSLDELRDVSVEPAVLDLVQRLDSPDFKEREAASEALRTNDGWRMQMYALLAGETVTVEQRCRLLQVIRAQLVNMPRGALGIEMAPQQLVRGGPIEIRIVDLIPGLPAERVLQVGDRIVAIDNQPLLIEDDLQSRVQSKRPGDTVAVTIRRSRVDDNGKVIRDQAGEPVTEVLNLQIALGSAEVLERQNRNLATVSQRVRNARRIEADAVTYAFAPKAQVVGLPSGQRMAARDDPIDQHPVILNLLVQIEMINERNPEQVAMMQEIWRRQLSDLKQLAQDQTLTADERQRMQRVAERFWELMNATP
jgi:hypothetical protein